MARKALVEKTKKLERKYTKALAAGKKPEMPTRIYFRCKLCGRNRAYMKRFDMCRICFRENASKGLIPGIKKSSW